MKQSTDPASLWFNRQGADGKYDLFYKHATDREIQIHNFEPSAAADSWWHALDSSRKEEIHTLESR